MRVRVCSRVTPRSWKAISSHAHRGPGAVSEATPASMTSGLADPPSVLNSLGPCLESRPAESLIMSTSNTASGQSSGSSASKAKGLFDKAWAWTDKHIGEPSNKLVGKIGVESFWYAHGVGVLSLVFANSPGRRRRRKSWTKLRGSCACSRLTVG